MLGKNGPQTCLVYRERERLDLVDDALVGEEKYVGLLQVVSVAEGENGGEPGDHLVSQEEHVHILSTKTILLTE